MAAHAEQLGVHVLDYDTEIKIEEQLRRILNGNVTDDEIQIIHRRKYEEVGFTLFVYIIRIETL